MKAYTYLSQGHFGLINKPKPELQHARDAIVRVTLSSICTSDLHTLSMEVCLVQCPESRSDMKWSVSWSR